MNKPLSILLDKPLDRFVDQQVASGRFSSPQQVVEAGLRLLEEEQAKLEGLRDALIEGENSGPSVPFDPEELMASTRERWKARG